MIRWAFFMLACLLVTPIFAGPRSKSIQVPKQFMQLGEPDQEKGREVLESFRGMGLQGDYYLQVELKVRPRRGDEIVFSGRLWGSRSYLGPVSRVELKDQDGQVRRYLLQNGSEPTVWSWREGDKAPSMTSKHLFEPLVAQTELTLFDLQMPYLYWPSFRFEGTSKILGRIAHVFLLNPPEKMAAEYSSLGGVRVYLDTQYHAMVKSFQVDQQGQNLKSMTVRDIEKVSGQWMVKKIDLRNEVTRDKTRFQVVRVALNLDFSPQLFTSQSLSIDVPAPEQTVSLGR